MKLKHKILAKLSFIYFQRLEQDNNKIDFKFTGLNGVLDQYIFDNNNFFLSFYEKSFQKQLGKQVYILMSPGLQLGNLNHELSHNFFSE